MRRLISFLIFIYSATTLQTINAQSPIPRIIDQGLFCVFGDLNEHLDGHLSEFTFTGIGFTRTDNLKDLFDPNPTSDYRVELTLTDGTVKTAFLLIDRSEVSHLPIPEGTFREGSWQAYFPWVREAKELRILFRNQAVYSVRATNVPLPYLPVITQIDKNRVRIDPDQVEEVEFTIDDGIHLRGATKKNQFPDGTLTLPIPSKPNQRTIVMIDVFAGLRRHTTWLVLDPQFAPPRHRLTLRSSRTPPALPSALSQHFAISAPLVVSVQARPLSFLR